MRSIGCASAGTRSGRSAFDAPKLLMRRELERLFRAIPAAQRPGAIIVVEVSKPAWMNTVIQARKPEGESVSRKSVEQSVEEDVQTAGPVRMRRRLRAADGITVIGPLSQSDNSASGRQRWQEQTRAEFGDAVLHGRAAFIVTTHAEQTLPRDILASVDAVVCVPRVDSRAVIRGIRRVTGSGDVQGITASRAGAIEPSDFWMARRPNQRPGDYVRRLMAIADTRLDRSDEPGLESLPGMGAVGDWGREMAADLQAYVQGTLAWTELERGVVLEGPPGCGKTRFARALAASAGVAFVGASLQQWQGARDGHLGHLLGAMLATFDQARSYAPSVLLVDELDGFGNRSSFTSQHRDYSTQVVNAFLEQLDGATAREGVFIVGCTNDVSGIDPAILRSGRLERVIRVPLPDKRGIESILRRYLDGDLADEDIVPLASSAVRHACSGADIERWVRAARGRARRAGRSLSLVDLRSEIGGEAHPVEPRLLRRIAMHEAGHAVAALFCGAGCLESVHLRTDDDDEPATVMDLAQVTDVRGGITPLVVRKRLRALLAGRAAEIVCLGSPSAGAGGSPTSDLAMATQVAVRAVAHFGLGDAGLLWHGIPGLARHNELLADPRVAVAVERMMGDAMNAALRLVRRLRPAVEAIGDELVRRGEVREQDVRALVRCAISKKPGSIPAQAPTAT